MLRRQLFLSSMFVLNDFLIVLLLVISASVGVGCGRRLLFPDESDACSVIRSDRMCW